MGEKFWTTFRISVRLRLLRLAQMFLARSPASLRRCGPGFQYFRRWQLGLPTACTPWLQACPPTEFLELRRSATTIANTGEMNECPPKHSTKAWIFIIS